MYNISDIRIPTNDSHQAPPVEQGPATFLSKEFCHPTKTDGTDMTSYDW
jgi:hypothetical protein